MTEGRRNLRAGDEGVALILVLLAILVLSTLAAAMVFSARADTFSSYNYRIGTQAEFVARAGIQKALNFFESSQYVPVDPIDTGTYNVTNTYVVPTNSLLGFANNADPYITLPVNLYYAQSGPVTCQSSVSGCGGSQVKLGTTSGSSYYPAAAYTNGVDVVSNWLNFLNTSTGSANTISDGLGGQGTYAVSAQLLNYHTVNNAQVGTSAISCTAAAGDPWPDPLAANGICRQPFEVWQVTSTGTWNSNVGAGAVKPTVQVVATISPMYLPYTGTAFYGLCSVTLSGSVCTDGYNSTSGSYGANYTQCVTPTTGTTNAQATGAGIGSNGGVTINGGAYQVGGNVTYANSDTGSSASCNTGFSGSANGVTGQVMPGSPIPAPVMPNMAPWGYSTTTPTIKPPKCTGSQSCVANVILNWATPTTPPTPSVEYPGVAVTLATGGTLCPSGYSGYIERFALTTGTPNTITNYSCSGIGASGVTYGTAANPYVLGDVSAGTSGSNPGTVNIIAPTTPISNPVFVAMNSVNIANNGQLNTSNSLPVITSTTAPNGVNSPYPTSTTATAFVLDDYTSLSIGGVSDLNFNPAAPGVPSPGYLTVNVECTGISGSSTCVSLTGQAQMSGVLIAPTANVKLGGSGSTGTFFGSILGNNITDSGGYPVHYDDSLSTYSGKLYSVQVVSVSRHIY